MDDFQLPGLAALYNPYGLPSPSGGTDDYGLLPPMPYTAPAAPFVVPPYRQAQAAPLPAPYIGGAGMSRGMARVQPALQALAGMGRVAASVLPFPAVQTGASLLTTAAQYGQQTPSGAASKQKPMDASTLTRLIKHRESSGNYQALNKQEVGNTASGAYQYTDRTWNNYGGYAKAMWAPPAIQDKRFADDIANNLNKYGGDPFKVIAAHYLPKYANDPSSWSVRLKVGKKTVPPVAEYISAVVKGSPLEAQFNEYLKGHQTQ